MNKLPMLAKQRGAVLVVGMILLGVIMLMVAGGFMLSSSNLKSVSNQQFRNEAIAAANVAIEDVTSSSFTDEIDSDQVDVDFNLTGDPEYTVNIAPPVCISAELAETTSPSSLSLHPGIATSTTWNTVWDIAATVSDNTSGANVTVHSGVRVLLSQVDKDSACPSVSP